MYGIYYVKYNFIFRGIENGMIKIFLNYFFDGKFILLNIDHSIRLLVSL